MENDHPDRSGLTGFSEESEIFDHTHRRSVEQKSFNAINNY